MPDLEVHLVFQTQHTALKSNYAPGVTPPGSALHRQRERIRRLIQTTADDLDELFQSDTPEYVPRAPIESPHPHPWGTDWEKAFGFRDILAFVPALKRRGFHAVNTRGRPTFQKRLLRIGGTSKRTSNRTSQRL